MSKPAPIPFKSLDFDAAAVAVERVSQSHNIPTLTFPQEGRGGETKAPAATIAPPAPAPEKSRLTERMPVTLPAYVAADIRQRALNAKTSYRFIIMQALKRGGIAIADEDLVEDGRRVR